MIDVIGIPLRNPHGTVVRRPRWQYLALSAEVNVLDWPVASELVPFSFCGMRFLFCSGTTPRNDVIIRSDKWSHGTIEKSLKRVGFRNNRVEIKWRWNKRKFSMAEPQQCYAKTWMLMKPAEQDKKHTVHSANSNWTDGDRDCVHHRSVLFSCTRLLFRQVTETQLGCL